MLNSLTIDDKCGASAPLSKSPHADIGNTNREGTRSAAESRDRARLLYDYGEKVTAEQRAYALQQLGARLTVLRPVFVTVLGQLTDTIYEAMMVNGFWDGEQRNFAAKTALVHSELSEMLEANRKAIEHDDKVHAFTGEEAEAADTMIRLLDMAGGFDLRLGDAIIEKMLFNLSRPHKHNKQY